jgi:SagB-type dehydrogenase family enzyme
MEKRVIRLTTPQLDGSMSLEKAIQQRRTKRSFGKMPLSEQQFSQILWAAQGMTGKGGFGRAAPSGGALYPSDVYAVVGEHSVEGFQAGVYLYEPKGHSALKVADGDRREPLAVASLGQMWVAGAAASFVVTAQFGRITVKYGDRGIRYALIEIGHIGQNIFLQCQTLGLAAGIVGAFHDREVARVIEAGENHEPLLILPVGPAGN